MPIPKNAKFLVYALIFTIGCHAVAMGAMLLFLLPGMPSGNTDLAHRLSYISEHDFLWRLGWFPWQVTAFSDLVFAVALLRTAWINRSLSWASAILTSVAIIIEQPAEFRWVTNGVDIAREAVKTGNYSKYLTFENEMFRLTSHWAAFFYTLAAISWSVALSKAGTWNRFMTILSCILWGLLILVSLGPLLFPIGTNVVSIGNAIGFNLMLIWFVGATTLVLRRGQTKELNT
jgi:hypothetical protein